MLCCLLCVALRCFARFGLVVLFARICFALHGLYCLVGQVLHSGLTGEAWTVSAVAHDDCGFVCLFVQMCSETRSAAARHGRNVHNRLIISSSQFTTTNSAPIPQHCVELRLR